MKSNVKIQDDTQSLQSCVSVSVTDFRVGNLVHYRIQDDEDEKNDYFEVSEIDVSDLSLLSSVIDYDYQPILISEEWLLKFGFISNSYQDRYENEVIHIEINNIRNPTELWIDRMPHIKYIHQLQNLYHALTGSELQIGDLTEH